MSIKFGIFPPRLAADTLYYKDIITFCVEDDKIIGAKQWDINGKDKVISYMDLPYDKRLTEKFSGVIDVDTSMLIGSIVRTVWLFNTEEEAYIQKIICLDKIRDYFYRDFEERKKVLDGKIPIEIKNTIKNIKKINPEYFL